MRDHGRGQIVREPTNVRALSRRSTDLLVVKKEKQERSRMLVQEASVEK